MRAYQWAIIGALWFVILVLGFIGFGRNASATGQSLTPLDLAYLTIQLIPMNSGAVSGPISWELNAARFLIPLLAAWTIVRALLSLFHDRWQQFLVRFWRDHVVICGLSRKGWLLTRGLLERGERVIVIEEDDHNDLLESCRNRGAIVLLGDATDPDLLRKAAVRRARHVIAVTADDGANAEIAVRVAALVSKLAPRWPRRLLLTCSVHLVDPQLCDLARARELTLEERSPFRLELFNVYQRGGRLMWAEYETIRQRAARGRTEPENAQAQHILVIGLGWLGEYLVIHAARSRYDKAVSAPGADEANRVVDQDSRPAPAAPARLRISVIDQEAIGKCRLLYLRYPKLAYVCDLVPWQINVHGPEFLEASYLEGGTDYPGVEAVFVCFDDDSLALRTGLALHHRLLRGSAPVIVRVAEAGGIAALLEPGVDGSGVFANVHAFGLLDHTCNPAAILGGTHDVLARAMHEDYVRRQLAAGDTPATNPSLVPWEELPDDFRQSNLGQADSIAIHLHALGYGLAPLTDWDAITFCFKPDEVERLAQLEHARFVAERQAAGWRYHAGPKDAKAKVSPDLVDWAKLPKAERDKNCATVADLPSVLAQAGFQIIKVN